MSLEFLSSLALYVGIYAFGGLMGFGAAALFCASGKSSLLDENIRLRHRIAELSRAGTVHRFPLDNRPEKDADMRARIATAEPRLRA